MLWFGRRVDDRVHIRELVASDLTEWVRLRAALWPDADVEELVRQCRDFVAGVRNAAVPRAVFVIDCGGGRLGGFQEVSIRGAVEGCATGRVAYLEGLLVERGLRRRGLARQLVLAAEAWARREGCVEIASDVLAGNHVSQKMHLRMGYGPVRPLVHFRKPLGPVEPVPVYAAVVCEPIDPSTVISLVHDRRTTSVRLAAGVVQSAQDAGRHLRALRVTDHDRSAELLAGLARQFREAHGLSRLAAVIRCGEVGVGETWAAAAVSARGPEAARDAAEAFLAVMETHAPVVREPVWRGVPIST